MRAGYIRSSTSVRESERAEDSGEEEVRRHKAQEPEGRKEMWYALLEFVVRGPRPGMFGEHIEKFSGLEQCLLFSYHRSLA